MLLLAQYFHIKNKKCRHEQNFLAVEKELPVFPCYFCKTSSLLLSKLQQHIQSDHQKFEYLSRFCQLGFCELKVFKDHMQSEHGLPVFDQQHTSLSNPSSSTSQASNIDHFPVVIELHESAIKNKLMTFVILNHNTERDLIEFTTLKKIEIRSLILDRTFYGPCKYNFRLNLLYLSKLLLENGSLEYVCKMEAVFASFSAHSSGWVLQLVNTFHI